MKTVKGLRYGFYIIFHPIDGFWCAKREKKGHLGAAMLILLSLIFLEIISYQYTGYIVLPVVIKKLNAATYFFSIAGAFALWCIANWCITSLVEGEGSIRDILMASGYALLPVVISKIPLVFLSLAITGDEVTIYTLIQAIFILWSGFLMLLGIMSIHQFSMLKTLATILIALLGMAVIVFLGLLFIALIQQMVNFVIQIISELSLRS